MNVRADCPCCHQPLAPSVDDAICLQCESCSGVFVPKSEMQQEFLKETGDTELAKDTALTGGIALTGDTVVSGDAAEQPASPPIECPLCHGPMQEVRRGDEKINVCGSCGGIWFDGGEVASAGPSAGVPSTLSRFLLYSMTLPERTVRSTIGLAAGAAIETAGFLVPHAFQSSKSYEIVVKNSLRLLTEDIGGVAGQPGQSETAEGFMARKAVGNFVDLAGLATLHVSPMWFLAIVSDVAYGSKAYVLELAEELKKQGLIDDTSTIHHVDDVLGAIQRASGQAAGLFDTPPLSVDQLKESLESTRQAIASADYSRVLPESELTSYWNEMRGIAVEEDVSLLSVSGALTMHTLGKVKTVSRGALTGVKVVGGLFNRHVVGHYVDALQNVRERGFYQSVNDSSAPYVEAVWNNFAVGKSTWTEEIVTGRVFGTAYQTVTGWFSTKSQEKPGAEEKPSVEPPA